MTDNNNTEDPSLIYIKRTQEILGKYVKKPSLTDKLLIKPPFRFLHDIIHVVIRDTGYFIGLYTEDELNSQNIKDRDGKMNFLQKIIDVVKLTTNAPLTVRTSKIVAGLEPNKTNELLQLIGEIIDRKLNWKSAVETVLSQRENVATFKKVDDNMKKPSHSSNTNKEEQKQSKQKHTSLDEKLKDNINKSQEKIKKKDALKNEKSSSKELSSKRIKDKGTIQTKQINTTKDRNITSKNPKSKEDSKQLKQFVRNEKSDSTKANKVDLVKSEDAQQTGQEQRQRQEQLEITTSSKKSEITDVKKPKKKGDVKSDSIEKAEDEISIENKNRESEQTNETEKVKSAASADEKLLAIAPIDTNKSGPLNDSRAVETGLNVSTDEMKTMPQHYNDVETVAIKNENNAIENANNNLEKEVNNPNEIELKESNLNRPKTSTNLNAVKKASAVENKKETSTSVSTAKSNIRRESTFTRDDNHLENHIEQTKLKTSTLRPPSVRPPSARPGAPRRRDKNIEIVLQPNEQIKIAGIDIKLDTYDNLDDDDDENFVIIENTNSINDENILNDKNIDNDHNQNNGMDDQEQQGFLVQQILETQREFMQDNELTQQKEQKNENNLSKSLITRQSSARSVNNLRDNITELSKSINSLGKIMEFIPEDIDAMQLELTMWRDAFTQATIELNKEKSLTESSTEPMKNQLSQIEANIAEYIEMIDSSRARILQNSEKIFNLLGTQ